MGISKSIREKLESASWIRKMFEEGARLKAELGAENIQDFTLGNPEIEPPEAVRRAFASLTSEPPPGLHRYMPNAGYLSTRRVVAERLERATGLPYTENHVVMTVGAGGALNAVLKALLDPGDEVIVLSPYFVEYLFYVDNHGGRVIFSETDDSFLPVAERVAAAITPRTKAMIINTPNNPTGVVYDEGTLRALGEVLAAADHPVYLISDEPYKAIVFEGARAPEVANLAERTITVTSHSKDLSLPGERIGFLAISPRIAEAAEIFGACTFTNRILGYVNAPALQQRVVEMSGDTQVDPSYYQRKRDRLYGALIEAGYRCVRPGGAFYMFPETPGGDDLAFVRLLAGEGVLTVPGRGFGRPGYLRISYAVSDEVIERSLPAFRAAMAKASGVGVTAPGS
jgi:aspartate aminotransferase